MVSFRGSDWEWGIFSSKRGIMLSMHVVEGNYRVECNLKPRERADGNEYETRGKLN